MRFVPECGVPSKKIIQAFTRELNKIDRILVLTGAGISTESGIPDYRSKKVGLYERSNHKPIQHSDFMKNAEVRRRYWARNYLAWPNFMRAQPNKTHQMLSSWEISDRFVWLITQNVDGLHTKAGSSMLTELHGCGHRVKCMSCDFTADRQDYQEHLRTRNPDFAHEVGEMAPDGDVMIPEGADETFHVPECPSCGGVIKTDVVFFGDNVSRKTVDFCYSKVDECDGILVLGSSLQVMSGYRFASLQQKPIFVINIGPTRADELTTAKLSCKVTDVISHL